MTTEIILIILVIPCIFGIRSLIRVFQGKEKCECPGDCSRCRIKCQSNKNYYGIQGGNLKQGKE